MSLLHFLSLNLMPPPSLALPGPGDAAVEDSTSRDFYKTRLLFRWDVGNARAVIGPELEALGWAITPFEDIVDPASPTGTWFQFFVDPIFIRDIDRMKTQVMPTITMQAPGSGGLGHTYEEAISYAKQVIGKERDWATHWAAYRDDPGGEIPGLGLDFVDLA